MIQAVWYSVIKKYVDLVLFFYFKKRSIRGKENISKKGAVLLVSNHKNALIDPLIIATPLHRSVHFLTRASAFKIGLVKWLLSTINMMPIYRMRDGKETLARNEEIFNKCFDILAARKCLLIFPEGTHDVRRLVRPLSKGFTRIVFGFLEKHPDIELHIVPIGLNYTDATRFAESVSVVFGKPILANPFYRENDL
ncbi:MAG: 1-acyl-sn-glycerol-3-phosphate acyltransferase [Flavobacteriaceae bacterium]|nr:1-acyl-sn-glycerol-3-phosphate acyltransferase [Flavobacteriaceae bacterium]